MHIKFGEIRRAWNGHLYKSVGKSGRQVHVVAVDGSPKGEGIVSVLDWLEWEIVDELSRWAAFSDDDLKRIARAFGEVDLVCPSGALSPEDYKMMEEIQWELDRRESKLPSSADAEE